MFTFIELIKGNQYPYPKIAINNDFLSIFNCIKVDNGIYICNFSYGTSQSKTQIYRETLQHKYQAWAFLKQNICTVIDAFYHITVPLKSIY